MEKSGSKGTVITGKERFADELRFLALGIFGGSLYFLFKNTALEYSTASNVSILVGSAPVSFNAEVMGNPIVWGNLIYLGLVASLLCFVAWNYAIERIGATRTTNLIYAQSIITMLIAALVLGERITFMAIAGAITLTAGMILAIRKQ